MPIQARAEWATTVVRLLDAVTAALDRGNAAATEAAITAWLELPAKTLTDSGASRSFGKRIRGRLRRMDAGEELDEPAPAAPRPRRRPAHPKAKMAAHIHRMLRLGSVHRASKSLQALPLAPPTEETLNALRALHPAEDAPAIPAATVAPVVITDDILVEVLRRLPKGAAPGLSGWTYEHVKAAVLNNPLARDSACRLINAIVSGRLPRLPCLLDSTLIALEKRNGGIRPIAIGEVWVRLAGLCAMAASPHVGKALAPLQLGVGTPGGSQCLGHAVRAGIAAEPEDVTVQLDYANAFNTVHRSAVLAATQKRWPEGLALTAWRYEQPTELHFRGAPEGSAPLLSQSGVQQGDPPASLAFGLALQDPLEQTKEQHPTVAIAAAHDDCVLQGPPADVAQAFCTLCRLSGDIGLNVSPGKCGAYSRDVQAAADTAAALGINHSVDGLVVAGTPVGTDAFVAAYASKTIDAACEAIDMLSELSGAGLSAQDHFLVLKSSLQMRGAHLPRVIPCAQAQPAVDKLERKVATAAGEIMQRPELADAQADQLTLPLRFGGMGIRATDTNVAKASFLSAAAMTQAVMLTGPARFRPFAGHGAEGLRQDWRGLHAAGGALWPPEAAEPTAECIEQVMPSAQREYYQYDAARKHAALLHASDTRGRARLLSVACRAASVWLDTLPMVPALSLPNAAFVSGMRTRLGITHMPANACGVRCACGRYLQPDDTDHAMTCSRDSGSMTLRHEVLKESVRRICQRSGVASSAEPMTRHLQGAQAAARAQRDESRGDILMVMPDTLLVVDISVIHPAAETYRHGAATTAGHAAAARDRQKRTRYQQADPTGYDFSPFSVESFGRLGQPAMALLKKLADVAASTNSVHAEDFITNALRELSVALIRGNHLVYRRSQGNMANVTGHAPRAGDINPSAEVQ